MRVAMTILQNATSTPGVSARLTSVELNEKAITMAMTASAPNVFALGERARVGEAVVVMPRGASRRTSPAVHRSASAYVRPEAERRKRRVTAGPSRS